MTLALALTVQFVWKCCAFIWVFWTKKSFSSSLIKVLVLQKTCFKVKLLKTFKIPGDCHIKTYRSRKRRAILKIPRTDFGETYGLFLASKQKLYIKKFCPVLRQKTISHFAVKHAERNSHLILSTRWITLFKHLLSELNYKAL